MKRIVNGVTYNTATSSRVAESRWNRSDEPDKEFFGTLYQTQGGAFFVDLEITRQRWNEAEREDETEVIHEFDPLSPDGAHKWIHDGDVEIFHNPFGEDPPEAAVENEPGATIYIRVPAALKKRVDEAARAANASANEWAMRCLETCLTSVPKKSEKPRRKV